MLATAPSGVVVAAKARPPILPPRAWCGVVAAVTPSSCRTRSSGSIAHSLARAMILVVIMSLVVAFGDCDITVRVAAVAAAAAAAWLRVAPRSADAHRVAYCRISPSCCSRLAHVEDPPRRLSAQHVADGRRRRSRSVVMRALIVVAVVVVIVVNRTASFERRVALVAAATAAPSLEASFSSLTKFCRYLVRRLTPRRRLAVLGLWMKEGEGMGGRSWVASAS
jgi:hypothetical protein